MAFNAGSIMATMGLDVSGFTRGMMQANAMASVFPSVVTNFLANPLLGIIDIAKRAGEAIVGMITDVANEGDNLGDMATNIGVPVEFLSGLGLVAEQAGSNVGELAEALKMLGKNAAEAMNGGGAAKTFQEMGVAVADSAGKMRPLQDIMMDVADGLAAMPAGGQRTAAAMDLLGRSGTNMIATLSQGSAAINEQIRVFDGYGRVVSSTAAKNADAFNDLLGSIGAAWAGLKRIFAEPIIAALVPQLEKLSAWIQAHPEQIRALGETVGNVLGSMVGQLNVLLEQLAKAFILVSTIKGAWEGAKFGAMFGPAGAVMGGIGGGVAGFAGSAYAVHKISEVGASINNNTYNTTVNSTGTAGGSKQDMEKLADDVKKSWQRSEGQRAVSGIRL